MSLFSCFNPAYCRGFSTRRGMEHHIRKKKHCTKYTEAIILFTCSGKSDLDTDSNSLDLIDKNNKDKNADFYR